MIFKSLWFFIFILTLSLGSNAYSALHPDKIKKQLVQITPPVAVAAKPIVTVLSIIPAQAEPGTKVTLSGSGFGENASVFIGSVEIPAIITDAKQAEFNLPLTLEAGLYALYMKRSDGIVGRTYNFAVLPVRPTLTSLQPSQISSCATGREREVTAIGSNFVTSSMLFFDGAVLPSKIISSDSISFMTPAVAGGLHQVQVKNSPENSSVPLTLYVETRPEIAQVTVGNEHVNYYELVITGKNFSQNSVLFIDGGQIGGPGGQSATEREKLIYIDCTKLIYQRHPYSPVNKDFRLQIINSGGEGSQVITVTAP